MVERFSLDGYVVDELIGFGGTGEVWRAHEVATGEVVALKRLRARGAAATERLRREAGILATVAGPHVIGLRRMVVDDDEAVMVMDYAAGGNLANIMAIRGVLPAPEVVTVAAPIAEALAAAHSRDLVHGDLTPANILFSANGRPLLADFGVARAMHSAAEGVEGTVEFLDPAVAAGGQPTAATDVFALGAVVFAALTGSTVWGSGPSDEVVARAALGRRPRLSEVAAFVTAELAEVIEAMLATDPDDRPSAKAAGIAMLKASPVAPVGLVQTTAPVPPPVTHVVRPAPKPAFFEVDEDEESDSWTPWRRRIVVAGAAGLALIGAIGVGVSLAGSGGQPKRVVSETPGAIDSTSPVAETGPVVPPRTAATDTTKWTAVVTHLDELRAQAFSEGDVASLAAVYVPGAPPYSADVGTLRSLASRGLHAQGFTAQVRQVDVESSTTTTERLRVVDRLSSYQLVDDSGAIVGHGRARPATAFTMQLDNVNGAWRVASITPWVS